MTARDGHGPSLALWRCNILGGERVSISTMKTRNLLLSAVTSLILVGATVIQAAEQPDHPMARALMHRLAEKLQLSEDQKDQIKAILKSDKDTLKPMIQNLAAARKELRTTIQADNTTEAAVRAASAKVAAVEADLAVERMKLYAKIAPILTDAQKQELANFD